MMNNFNNNNYNPYGQQPRDDRNQDGGHGTNSLNGSSPYNPYAPYQRVVNTSGTPTGQPPYGTQQVTGTTPQKQKPKKEKSGYLSKKAAAIFMALCVLASAGLGIGGGAIAYQTLKNNGSSAGSNVTMNTVVPNGDNTKTVSYTGNAMSVSDVAALTAPSVVEITTENVTTDSYMQQYVQQGAGSGVIISADGYIVTNNHVIANTSKITVTTKDGSSYEAKLVGTDSETDVALLKIEATGLSPATLGNSSDLNVGDTAIVIGNPLGQLGGTVTSGIISALDRQITLEGTNMTLLQTNAAINPGNSGGGLFNDKGELVGIVVAKSSGTLSDGATIEGLGFAIPVDKVKTVVEQLSTYGYVTGRPSLGVNLVDITTSQQAMMYRVSQPGVYVLKSTNSSNGLEAGDRIVSIDGAEVASADEVKAAIQSKNVGDTLSITVSRGGQVITVQATLTESKPAGEDDSNAQNNAQDSQNNQNGQNEQSGQDAEKSIQDWLGQFGF